MPKYLVTIPIAGAISKEIEADSEEDAIEKGMNEDWIGGNISDHFINGWDLDELETYEKTSEGNVDHLNVSEATAEEQEE